MLETDWPLAAHASCPGHEVNMADWQRSQLPWCALNVLKHLAAPDHILRNGLFRDQHELAAF